VALQSSAATIRYEVTASGPKGYQVTAIGPGWEFAVVGDFCSKLAAEGFAAVMRRVDASPSSHAATEASTDLVPGVESRPAG
jgi:hypothetical protein